MDKEVFKEMINSLGLITTSNMVGGYEMLKKMVEGTDLVTREALIKTVQEFVEYNGSFNLHEIGLEEIPIYEDDERLENVYYLDKLGFEVSIYGLGDDGYWDEEEQDSQYYNYNTKNEDDTFILPTYELRDIVDSIMVYYETYKN